MKQEIRISIEMLIGIILSVLIDFMLITIGYSQFDQNNSINVQFFGITIYKISKTVSEPNVINVTFWGILFSIFAVVIGESWISKKGKSK